MSGDFAQAQSHPTTRLSREAGQRSQLPCLRAGWNSAFRDRNFQAVKYSTSTSDDWSKNSHLLRTSGRRVVMEAYESYQYSELTEVDTIRLIYLQPCEGLEAGVECSLKDARLSEYRDDIGDHYIAISYVWGDQNDTRSILVNGKRLEITASLDSALRHIRDHRRVLRVWADGVCINQKDTRDRNWQVRLMGDIYSFAQHTVIFLGLSSPQCDSVMQLMASATQELGGLLDGHEATVEDEILARPWFTRVWILQELVLSQNPWVQCGKWRIRWHLFCRSILSSQSGSWKPDSRTVLRHMGEFRTKSITTSHSILKTAKIAPGETLFDLLQKRKNCGLSDPRDLIYAHLGLIDAYTRTLVAIDYDKPLTKVYEEISRMYIQCIGLGIMLFLVEQNRPDQRESSLPSWALDWSLQYELDNDSFNTYEHYYRTKTPTLSFIVPRVAAVCGWNSGTIDRIIPLSSWPRLEASGPYIKNSRSSSIRGSIFEPRTLSHLLEWVSKKGKQASILRQLLIDSSASLVSRSYVEPRAEAPFWPEHGIKASARNLFQKVVSTMSAWPEMSSRVSSIMASTTWNDVTSFGSSTSRKEWFITLCLLHLVSLTRYYHTSKQIAVLKGDQILAPVPNTAQLGDIVANLCSGANPERMVLRLRNNELTHVEEWSIRDAMIARYTDTVPGWMSSNFQLLPIQNCRFIATASCLPQGPSIDGLYAGSFEDAWNKPPMNEKNQRIFAIH